MTASQPVAADPLSATAPVVNTPAEAAPVITAADSPAGDMPADHAEPIKKKKSPLLLIGLVLLLLLMMVVVGGGAAAYLLSSSKVPVAQLPELGKPTAADPGEPPPLPAFTVATAASKNAVVTKASNSLGNVMSAAQRLRARALVGAGEGAAPRDFVVRGGGVTEAGLDLPTHERWELLFPPGTTIETYARQLDFFQIELGVIGGSQNVTYLSNLINQKPTAREAPGSADRRLYLIWNHGPMQEADEILVKRAGLNPAGKVLAHFCPPELEAQMLRVEAAQAKVNKFTHLRRTVFGIEIEGVDTFRLTVTEQKGD